MSDNEHEIGHYGLFRTFEVIGLGSGEINVQEGSFF